MLFTGIGVYAWKRKKPMWFWSGSTVKESEISNIAAYNRANGIMWLVFSLVMWISTILGVMNMKAGGISLNCWLYHRSPSSSNSLWKDLPKLQKMTPD